MKRYKSKNTKLFQDLMEYDKIHKLREQLSLDVSVEAGTLLQSLGNDFPSRIIKTAIANILLEIVGELMEEE